jgi:hypothetical protein
MAVLAMAESLSIHAHRAELLAERSKCLANQLSVVYSKAVH